MSTQEFRESVGQVVQAETVTQHFGTDGRQLTRKDRLELNSKVKQLVDEYGQSGRDIWLDLHAAIGVNAIDEMCRDQRDVAHRILDLMLELAEARRQLGSAADNNTDSAASQASLVLQNSNLVSQLKNAARRSQQFDDYMVKTQKKISDLNDALAYYQAETERKERLVEHLSKDNRRLTDTSSAAHRRGNWLWLWIGVLALATAAAASGMAYHARLAGAATSQCELNGKSFAVGTTMPGRNDQECARSERGWAEWSPKPQAKKK